MFAAMRKLEIEDAKIVYNSVSEMSHVRATKC